MQYGSFLVSRIKKINEIKLTKTAPDNLKTFKIIYELECNPENIQLQENEKIIEKKDNKVVIEMNTSNDFLARQRLLEYGPICTILKPENFKNEFVNLLKDDNFVNKLKDNSILIPSKLTEKYNDSCIKLFEFIKMLYQEDVEFKKVIDHFSNGQYDGTSNTHVTLNKYLNAMKIFGIKVKKINKKYHMLSSIYKIKFNSNDIKSINLLKEAADVLTEVKNKSCF